MHLEANRMASLSVSYAALVLEQEEIFEERRAEIDDVPEMRLDLHLRSMLYNTHPYGVPVLGWPEKVSRLTTQDVTTFHHMWYVPNNALLIVAGDITAEQLVPLVHQYYGSIPARDVPIRQRPLVSGPPGGQRLVMQEPHVRAPLGRTFADVAHWQVQIAAVTPTQVHAAAQAVLRAERSVTGMLLPVAAGNATVMAPQQRKKW
jgi:zinc protease